ncbi:ABC transporter ATP-binding protein [Sediminispirochaeta bajacaliforniensis]|uniref:ABC transporter ATP-binding protein n=1 Tax=Sediminispirochaeta bajacaliforniensis TaxID=148 RepID=UPI0003824FB0|nr:dipeptide ABC transporter ATP-binding protein [Sediminispirochaeta bajacaliforniensis]
MTSLLRIENVRIAFRRKERLRQVVHGIDLRLGEHESLAIVGESGSGKTVTAASILRLLGPSAEYPSGEIYFREQELLRASERTLLGVRGKEIGMIFQEPMSSLNPLQNIGRQVAESLFLHGGTESRQNRTKVVEMLRRVGLRNAETRLGAFPHQLSGGERQRVMIAMAIVNRPRLLIADEPTTALDVTIQAQILDLLLDLKRELGMAMIFITHDLSIVGRIADRVVVMKEGEIVEEAETKKLFATPAHPYTRLLIESEPATAPPERSAGPDETLLEIRNLKVHFPVQRGILKRTVDYIKAVDGVSLSIPRGGSFGLVGESGSGKTSLGRALLRLIPSNGEIFLKGQPVHNLKNDELRPLRRWMQPVFQDPFGTLSPRMCVTDIVGEGLRVHENLSIPERQERVASALEEVGLDPGIGKRYPHEFSGGQRQRIALARALVLKPDLLVLDEPTSSLDRSIQFQVIELLLNIQAEHGLTYLFISHDLKVVRALCRSLGVMKQGVLVEQGDAEQVMKEPQQEYTRRLLETAFMLDQERRAT